MTWSTKASTKASTKTSTKTTVSLYLGLVALALATAGRAVAVPIDDAHPEASVAAVQKSGDPLELADLLLDLSARGERAAKRGDHVAAARIWLAVTQAVPERTYGFARLCDALDANGQRDQAIVACRTALTRQGTTAGDYTHFVKLLLTQGGDAPLTASDRRQVDLAIGQLAKEPAAALITDRVRCNLAAHEHDLPGLEACTARLVAAAPADTRSIAFQWALALEKGDRAGAALHFQRAAAGADKDTLSSMTDKMRVRGFGPTRPSRAVRFVRWAAFGLLGSLGLFGLHAIASRGLAGVRRRTAA